MDTGRPFAFRLAIPTLLLAAACSPPTQAPQPPPKPKDVNVVFILLDAVRADHTTPYGYAEDTTPFLASVAQKGVVFERAYATSTWTPSSMASIFTSLNVNQHGVLTGYRATKKALERGEGMALNRIPKTTETLPEVMKALGYRTFGIADNVNISERMGFARGFDRFAGGSKEGSEVVNATLAGWRAEIAAGGKYFLYLHYMDAHQPYRKRAPWYDEKVKPARASVEAYDSNLAYMDERVREVFGVLGLDASALVLITADHGEEFGDHGGAGHGNQLYEELLRVPLIACGPGFAGPRRVKTPVSTLDLLPTLREIGQGRPSRFDQGVSLLRSLAGPSPGEPRTLFPMRVTEVGDERIARKGVVRERWKYILTLPEKTEELYDLEADPKERRNLVRKLPEVAADLRARLEAFERTAKVHAREFGGETHISPEQAEQLKALGYVQ